MITGVVRVWHEGEPLLSPWRPCRTDRSTFLTKPFKKLRILHPRSHYELIKAGSQGEPICHSIAPDEKLDIIETPGQGLPHKTVRPLS